MGFKDEFYDFEIHKSYPTPIDRDLIKNMQFYFNQLSWFFFNSIHFYDEIYQYFGESPKNQLQTATDE